jgi:hypothetical protein
VGNFCDFSDRPNAAKAAARLLCDLQRWKQPAVGKAATLSTCLVLILIFHSRSSLRKQNQTQPKAYLLLLMLCRATIFSWVLICTKKRSKQGAHSSDWVHGSRSDNLNYIISNVLLSVGGLF